MNSFRYQAGNSDPVIPGFLSLSLSLSLFLVIPDVGTFYIYPEMPTFQGPKVQC